MRPGRAADIWCWLTSRTRFELGAILLWGLALLFVNIRAYAWPEVRTVYPIFSASARLWWSGEDLYFPDRPADVAAGYRYGPAFTVLLTPFGLLPDALGGVVWRLFSVAAVFGALAWLARSVLPMPLSRDQFACLALLTLPLTLQSLNNGQSNLIIIAALMGCVAAVKEERWNIACALMAIAFACKIYPLALGMLLALLYPRQLGWRMALTAAATLLAPFLLQHPDYVADQYQKWIVLLETDDRTTASPTCKLRDLWLLIDLYGLPISRSVYAVLQILGGAGIAGLLWWRQRQGWSDRPLLTSCLALSVLWMLLLGPAVESSTFVLLAPSLGFSLLEASARTSRWRKLLLVSSAGFFLAAILLGAIANTGKLHFLSIHPWATLLYGAFLLTEPSAIARAAGQPACVFRAAA